ncbi:MAG: radical SAM protein [Bacillota bacterium]
MAKISKYHVACPDDLQGGWLLFSAATGALLRLDDQEYAGFERFSRTRDPNALPETTQIGLRGAGILIDDEIDEGGMLRACNHRARFSDKEFILFLVPSLACNFGCTYCYQHKMNLGTLSQHGADLLHYIRSLCREYQVLRVIYSNGEPLLQLDWIEQFHPEVLKIAAESGTTVVMGGFITNGYLLGPRVAERLQALGIRRVQITLDGPPHIHDANRPLISGKPTFAKIIENLQTAVGVFESISIRVNVSSNNVNTLNELLDILAEHGLKQQVQIYLAPVESNTSVCANVADECLDMEAFAAHAAVFYREALRRGFWIEQYPHPKSSACMTDYYNSVIVGPDGRFWKCSHELGVDEYCIGQLGRNPTAAEEARHLVYIQWDPFQDPECLECPVLPVCVGGCPYDAMWRGPGSKRCVSWKYNMAEMLPLVALQQEAIREARAEYASKR